MTDKIGGASERIQKIVDRMRVYARKSDHKHDKIDFYHVVNTSLEFVDEVTLSHSINDRVEI